MTELATCANCRGDGWVCEDHRSDVQGHGGCGGAGEPCPACNPMATGFSRLLHERDLLAAGARSLARAVRDQHHRDCPLHRFTYEVGSGEEIPTCTCRTVSEPDESQPRYVHLIHAFGVACRLYEASFHKETTSTPLAVAERAQARVNNAQAALVAEIEKLNKPQAPPGRYEPGVRDYRERWWPTCPVCNGTGELPEAVQAWDVPGAPVPPCPHCEDGRLNLNEMLSRPGLPQDSVDSIAEIIGRYERVWSDIAEHGDDLSTGAALLALEEIKDELTGRGSR